MAQQNLSIFSSSSLVESQQHTHNDCFSFCKMHGLGNDYLYIDCCFGNGHSNPSENDFRKFIKHLNIGPNENDENGSLSNHHHHPNTHSYTLEHIIQKLCHRNFGIGADGVIFITTPNLELLEENTIQSSSSHNNTTIHCRMEMYNSDGSSGEMCGNGLRCVAQYACDRLIAMKKIEKNQISHHERFSNVQYGYHVRVQSHRKVYDCICYAGVEEEGNKKRQQLCHDENYFIVHDQILLVATTPTNHTLWVEIEMGQLQTQASNFDMATDFENPLMEVPLVNQEEGLVRKVLYHYTQQHVLKIPLYCLLVPNPHAICFVNEIGMNDKSSVFETIWKDVNKIPLALVGSVIENDREIFPQRTNVEFIEMMTDALPTNVKKRENRSTLIEMLESNCVLRVRQRTWERGSGETNACGTGAFAVSQLVYLRKFYGNGQNNEGTPSSSPPPVCTVQVKLNGGDLYFNYDRRKQDDATTMTRVNMIGPVTYVCNGSFRIFDFL
ncbi:hypothetical protein FDP41_012444 [Naegleria fowleri]|uniref:diaminopimelate epimerase n=1 Tax=Naegleria fowleri TaxID=5763 RepID=A0A6A5BWZ9_NAEFO|nr:uncharacterized protein FDP41_012444 [Naegleria fowleri]KAF0981787.1 hypothetical protein FDP41_012444 [Naegleria fowleri]